MQDCLRIIGVFDLRTYTQDIPALPHIVIDIVVRALVRELRHLDLFRSELLIQVEQVQARRRKVLDAGQKDSRLKLRHRRLELGRNEREGLVLNA